MSNNQDSIIVEITHRIDNPIAVGSFQSIPLAESTAYGAVEYPVSCLRLRILEILSSEPRAASWRFREFPGTECNITKARCSLHLDLSSFTGAV